LLIKQSDSISLQVLETGVIRSLVSEGWNTTREKLVQNGPDILVRGLIFIVILLVFRFLSRLTRRAVTAACERPGMDLSTLLKDVLVSVSGGTVMAIGFLMALSQIGISLGPMLAGLGIAGFVIGFALQDTLGNFAAGGMILIYRPYDVDDFVEVAGASGFVRKMSLVSTTITTFDNQTLVVPNSKIWGDVIKNVTAQKVRRVDMVFGIGYGDDVENAERILKDILDSHEKVLEKPESVVRVHELGDSSVNFAVRPWVRTEDYWDVYWDITREVKLRFDREGVSIPFPQRDVHLYQESS
jgi:small conductance mechanosensitive channel